MSYIRTNETGTNNGQNQSEDIHHNLIQSTAIPVSQNVTNIINGTNKVSETDELYKDVIGYCFKLLGPDVYSVLTDNENFLYAHAGENAINLPIAPGDVVPEGSVSGLALKTGNHVRSYKSSAESKFGGIPYSGRSSIIYREDVGHIKLPIGAISVVTSTKFEESFIDHCDILIQYINVMESIIGRLGASSMQLDTYTTQIQDIGLEIKNEVLPQILQNVGNLERTVHMCNNLSYNSQIVALRAGSNTFKVIAKEISAYAKAIGGILVRIKSVEKKIQIIVNLIERLMSRIDEFAKKSVQEGCMIVDTTDGLIKSLQEFRKELELKAFQTLVENKTKEEFLADQEKRTRVPANVYALPARIQRIIELLPTIALNMDAHIFVGVPMGGDNQKIAYIAGSCGRNPIPGFNMTYDTPAPHGSLLYRTVSENRDIRSVIPREKSAYGVAGIANSVRIFDEDNNLIGVMTLVAPWDNIESVQISINVAKDKINTMHSFITESATVGTEMTHIVSELKALIEYIGRFSNISAKAWTQISEQEPSLQQLRLACNIEGSRENANAVLDTKNAITNDFTSAGDDLRDILSTYKDNANSSIKSMGQLSGLVRKMTEIIGSVNLSQENVSTGLTEIQGMTSILLETIQESDTIIGERIAMLHE